MSVFWSSLLWFGRRRADQLLFHKKEFREAAEGESSGYGEDDPGNVHADGQKA